MQWLCRDTFNAAAAVEIDRENPPGQEADPISKRKIDTFFASLASVVDPSGRCVLQVYLEHEVHGQWLLRGAEGAGFQGTLVSDIPHSNPAKKFFICLHRAPPPSQSSSDSEERVICPISWPLRCACSLSHRASLLPPSTSTSSVTSAPQPVASNIYKEHIRLSKRAVRVLRRAIALSDPLPPPPPPSTASTSAPTASTAYKYESTWMSPRAARFLPDACSGPTLLTIGGLRETQLPPSSSSSAATAPSAASKFKPDASTFESSSALAPLKSLSPSFSASSIQVEPPPQPPRPSKAKGSKEEGDQPPESKRPRIDHQPGGASREEVAELTMIEGLDGWKAAEARQLGLAPLLVLWRDFSSSSSASGLGEVFTAIGSLVGDSSEEQRERLRAKGLGCISRPVSIDVIQSQSEEGETTLRAIVAGYRGPDSLERWRAVDNTRKVQ